MSDKIFDSIYDPDCEHALDEPPISNDEPEDEELTANNDAEQKNTGFLALSILKTGTPDKIIKTVVIEGNEYMLVECTDNINTIPMILTTTCIESLQEYIDEYGDIVGAQCNLIDYNICANRSFKQFYLFVNDLNLTEVYKYDTSSDQYIEISEVEDVLKQLIYYEMDQQCTEEEYLNIIDIMETDQDYDDTPFNDTIQDENNIQIEDQEQEEEEIENKTPITTKELQANKVSRLYKESPNPVVSSPAVPKKLFEPTNKKEAVVQIRNSVKIGSVNINTKSTENKSTIDNILKCLDPKINPPPKKEDVTKIVGWTEKTRENMRFGNNR